MKANNKRSNQAGFTLVEIAIVLVIIGLLLGGILKGQEMITQAKIKNVVNDLNGVSAAMYGYQDRYKALPGDDKNANPRWAASKAGDGDGVVGGKYLDTATLDASGNVTAGSESAVFWHHLRLAGFISGTGPDQPFNAVSGKMGVQTGDGAYVPATTAPGPALAGPSSAPPGFTALILCSANLPDKIAISVDSQMDDGIAISGSVRGQKQSQPNPAITNAATAYVEDGVSTYVVCRTL